MKQIWIGILNGLNSGKPVKTISVLYDKVDVRMPYDPSFTEVKNLLVEKIEAIIASLPDDPIEESTETEQPNNE
jgi:hypothetical protein